jgi:hypothetical protein
MGHPGRLCIWRNFGRIFGLWRNGRVLKMNSYIVFYQTGEDDLTRDYVEIDATDATEAETETMVNFPNKNIISIWERV